MIEPLLTAASRHADVHCRGGVAPTPISGVTILRETKPSALQFAISKPLVAIVLQGRKRVTIGTSILEFGAGDSLLITANAPTVSQITEATSAVPYLSLVIDLEPAVIEALIVAMEAAPHVSGQPVRIGPTDDEVADTALRLMRLLDRPASLAVLRDQLIRELHFWLLSGELGPAIRALGVADSHSRRIARAIAMIRSDYARTMPIDTLAQTAGMSVSSFHQHFRKVTSSTPLQFLKQSRLIEARRILVSEGRAISDAAFAVGYESVSQFTREYGRMFGMPPARDIRAMRTRSGTVRQSVSEDASIV